MQYVNIHSHIFNMDNAPERFLHLYLPEKVADFIDSATNTKLGAAIFAKVLPLMGNAGKRYATFLKIGKSKNQLEVFEHLLNEYDDSHMQFTALTMFMERCGAGDSRSGFEGQIEEVVRIKKQYHDKLNIFLGIDPRWLKDGRALHKSVTGYFNTLLPVNATRSVAPFCGLKLYPSTGFFAYDERLKETFEWAQETGVPVMTHCNYLGGIFNNSKQQIVTAFNTKNPYPGAFTPSYEYYSKNHWMKWILGTNGARKNKYSCSYFLEPASFSPLLSYMQQRYERQLAANGDAQTDIQPFKICFAHCGGGDQLLGHEQGHVEEPPYGTQAINWYDQIKSLMKQFPGVYADISYTLWDKKTHRQILKDLQDPQIGSRLLFGTDYFMTEREQAERQTYRAFKSAAIVIKDTHGLSLWDRAASVNIKNFLRSRYYQ